MIKRGSGRKGQVTVFVIIALVLVAGVIFYFAFRGTLFPSSNSSTFTPVENQLISCLKSNAQEGIKVLEGQGGYINPPAFIPGSSYMPFSSQLDFLGLQIPYWHTFSGNNIPVNQVPTKTVMENQLSEYLQSQIKNCNLNSFTNQGYSISEGTPTVQTSIGDNYVKVFLNMDLNMKKGSQSDTIQSHQVQVDSSLGSLYNDAIKVDNLEQQKAFLENYSIDILNNYAPVNGFVLSCSPKTWNANKIFSQLKNATEANFMAVRNNGPTNDYFALHLPISASVRVLNSQKWPSTYEIEGTNSPTLIAKPIGNQQGLGIVGFCYVPYHFVYNIKYPLLVQLSQNGETFQFPVSVIIQGNTVNKTANLTAVPTNKVNLCATAANSTASVNVVNSLGQPINANVSYSCLGSTCEIGTAKNGFINGSFPQCVNGKVTAESQGYQESSKLFTSVGGGNVTVVLNKIYNKEIYLNLTNAQGDENAIITFTSNSSGSHTILYPNQKQMNLTAGNYSVQVYVYANSSMKFNATTTQQCSTVPDGVIGGIFGVTHKVCNQVSVPAQNISQVLVAGGNSQVSISANELSNSKEISLNVERYKTPQTLQELEIIYTLVESKSVGVSFI